MIKLKAYFILLIAAVTIISCNKDDDKVAPPRDRSLQYVADLDSIESYLKSHYIKTVEVDGQVDVIIDSITPSTPQTSIWDNTDYPLQYKMVHNDIRKTKSDGKPNNMVDGKSDDVVEYKMYYLI